MSEADPTHPLPPARILGKAAQFRVLAIVAGVVVAVLVLIAVVRATFTKPTPPPAAAQPGTLDLSASQFAQLGVATVQSGVDPGAVSATGTISVDEDHSTPVVLPYSGQVTDVYVEAGQRVTRGQVLLRIASGDFVEARDTLFAAVAQRSTAAAALKTAQDNTERQKAIYESAGGALKDYKQAQSDLVAAQSALRTADAALGAARDKLGLLGKSPAEIAKLEAAADVAGIYSQTAFHAPVSGTIASRDVSPGQFVSSGGDKPLMTISDLSHVWLVAQIDQTDASRVHLGDKVVVTTPAYPGRVFHAVIDNIGATLDPDTHRLPVRATVANPDEALKPQMFASFTIAGPEGNAAILVPSDAVIHEGDSARVWVVESGHHLVARDVVVTDSSGGYDRVGAGLRPGERIVTSGAIFVNEAGLGE